MYQTGEATEEFKLTLQYTDADGETYYDKIAKALGQIQAAGISISPPDINLSDLTFKEISRARARVSQYGFNQSNYEYIDILKKNNDDRKDIPCDC